MKQIIPSDDGFRKNASIFVIEFLQIIFRDRKHIFNLFQILNFWRIQIDIISLI